VTDTGRRRQFNQDYVYASEQPVGNLPNLFLVADGMGGHNAGDYASRYTVETIVSQAGASMEKEPERILGDAIRAANYDLRRRAKGDVRLSGMGTTVVAASCLEDRLQVANVGDSRLYVVNREIVQITRDHSLVEELVRMGGIDKAGARNHPDRNIITRAIGADDWVEVDFFTALLQKGDLVLLCSDGLTNMLEDEEIRGILRDPGKEESDLAAKAAKLVKTANDCGGRDNIAVILIQPFA
jgi:protein phosphatase